MHQAFYDYVRRRTDVVPEGYTLKGLEVYRYLVFLGASQMVEACFPQIKQALSSQAWETMIVDFVKQSNWSSNFYADLEDEFLAYLARTTQATVE